MNKINSGAFMKAAICLLMPKFLIPSKLLL